MQFSITITIDHSKTKDLEFFIDSLGLENVSFFENTYFGFSNDIDENGFPIAVYFDCEIFLNYEEILSVRSLIFNSFQNYIKEVTISRISFIDWRKIYEKGIKPVITQMFYIYNGDQERRDDGGRIPIVLSSSMAFGSGEHETTSLCIKLIENISESFKKVHNILDMGCGTGILGICALKLWPDANLTAIDIDQDAVSICAHNLIINNEKGDVIQDNIIPPNIKFDLILSNILKKPLEDLAVNFMKSMNNNGKIIISGFIDSQLPDILKTYDKCGFTHIVTLSHNEWQAVIFEKNYVESSF